MRAQTHQPARRGRPSKRNSQRVTLGRIAPWSIPGMEPHAFEMFSDRLDDRVEYERIIRDFVSVHDAVFAADEYDS
ncbi:MAG: hypothetical protein OEP48_04030 [Betaproteobacteria bacterium]|nr:hypothetical protein [Betaproteobacteria bacterium]MDH3437761.1 hypothetical protein [Betaproteobacteria bacterium]